MAFQKGSETTEGARIVRYIGVAPCYVLAVNPDEKKAAELLGYEATIAPYVNTVEVNGKQVPNVRLDFIVKTDIEKCGIETTSKLTFFIQKSYVCGSQSGKFQVIDKYGRTAWATKEEITGKKIPQYSNGPANISADYRPAYVGEAELTDFLIKYLNIPNVMKWDNKAGKFVGMVENPEDSEARLDKIDDYFKGDFKELNTILSYQPTNKVKLLWGVRTNAENRTYQTIYSRMVLPNRTNNYAKLEEEIKSRKDNGALADTTFEFCELKEYDVNATDFSKPATADDPFATATSEPTSDLPWN